MKCSSCGPGNQVELQTDGHPFLRPQESEQTARFFIPTGSNLLRLRFVEFHPSRNGVAEATFRARTA